MKLSPKRTAVIKSYARAFVAAALLILVEQLRTDGALDWTAVLVAGVTAIAGPVIKWIDSSETAFGRGSE